MIIIDLIDVIDPTGRFLYVRETVPNRILRFRILSPGNLGRQEVFVGPAGRQL